MNEKISKKQAEEILKSSYVQSEKLLQNKDELEVFLHRLEKKISEVPVVGNDLAVVPTMILLVKNFVEGKYRTIPYGTIVAIVGALIYFLSPVDVIPDFIIGIGHADDAAVVGVCFSLVKADIEAFDEWRQSNGLIQ